jgi:hypothetical protein
VTLKLKTDDFRMRTRSRSIAPTQLAERLSAIGTICWRMPATARPSA